MRGKGQRPCSHGYFVPVFPLCLWGCYNQKQLQAQKEDPFSTSVALGLEDPFLGPGSPRPGAFTLSSLGLTLPGHLAVSFLAPSSWGCQFRF